MSFVFKMMDLVLKMMDFVVNMMDFALKMMDLALKNDELLPTIANFPANVPWSVRQYTYIFIYTYSFIYILYIRLYIFSVFRHLILGVCLRRFLPPLRTPS